MKKLNIALCGCRGHAVKFGNLVNSYDESQMIAVWDNEQALGEAAANALNCLFENDYDRLLALPDLDGVIITAENALHRELAVKAAQAHKHIFIEKPLCTRKEDAFAIQKAVHENDVRFYMSDPFVRAPVIYMKRMMDSGRIGRITAVHIHVSNDNGVPGRPAELHPDYSYERMGGGVMADIGGHALHALHYLLGKPNAVTSVFSSFHDEAINAGIEESAMMIMQYPQGILASVESSFVSQYESLNINVYGMEGTICLTNFGGCNERWDVKYKLGNDPWTVVPEDYLPAAPLKHTRYWVNMMVHNIPNENVGIDDASNNGMSIDNAVECAEITDAIYRSVNQGTVLL